MDTQGMDTQTLIQVDEGCNSTTSGYGADLISEDEMLDLIEQAIKDAGNAVLLAKKMRMKSAAPIYLALRGERNVSDGVALYFGFERQPMFRRIGNASHN